ncbi:MAG: glutamine--fructose-6-phosphate aminotransferase [Elusimicrobia bacterium RIFOXYA2_FULL_39_19]|nr:MAG: glutamine--fructose-6-phosphate aminotransferase [Elusimicrobia bacterium RIFOXYA2_FULL_39_19]
MCGIVGYIGNKFVDSVLVVGLERLEYRGYDSAGIATISSGELFVCKKKGKLKALNDCLKEAGLGGNIGIGHTRWATHGEPSEINAHPHTDCKNEIAVVHNGIIENYQTLKEDLVARGHFFKSETDTEVIPHLIEENISEGLETAVRKAVAKIKGSFSICVISESEPDKIITAKFGSPLVIGLGKNENFIASDVTAILPHTKQVIVLNDGEIGIVSEEKITVTTPWGDTINKEVETVSWKAEDIEKGNYQFFMQKEIFEQPKIIETVISKKVTAGNIITLEEMNLSNNYLAKVKRIIIQACGTSWHAGLIGKYWLEKYAHIHTEVDVSSEYRYRNPIAEGDTLMLAISQSGETADTLAGIREGKSKFIKVLSIVNVVKSTIARESDGIIPIMAGPEIGVASTKAFTAQLTALYLFALQLGKLNYTISDTEAKNKLEGLIEIPKIMNAVLKRQDEIIKLSEKYYQKKNFIFLGRGINYPNALEGALKLKEISYIHSTGYPAGEFKHGPIALICEDTPVICLAPKDELYIKMISNIEEVKARKGKIISIATQGDTRIQSLSEDVFFIPECHEDISPIVTVLPLQLLAYHIAVKLGFDVDKPRNLAKSVTVE